MNARNAMQLFPDIKMREDAPRCLEEASCDASDTFLPRQPYSCLGCFEDS